MKTNSLLIYFFLLFCFSNCHGQASKKEKVNMPVPIRPEILRLTQKIAADNMLKSAGVGYGGVRTEQWERYETLKKDATDEELGTLTSNANSVVRCYAFQALAIRKATSVFPILLNHLADDEKVETFQGCIQSSQKAGDYFIEVVTPEYIDVDAYKLSQKEKAILDSTLIFDKSVRIDSKEQLLSSIKPNQLFYNRIRDIALSTNNPQAVLALARFQNKSDIEIIKKSFTHYDDEYYAAYAAREFPDSVFYPYLTKIFEKEWKNKYYDYAKWRILIQALAKYPTPITYQLFERIIKTQDSFRAQTLGVYLKIALRKYPSSMLSPLDTKIKLDDFHLDDFASQSDIEK